MNLVISNQNVFTQNLLRELMEKETKLHKLNKTHNELVRLLGILPNSFGQRGLNDMKKAAEAISQLKYKTMEAKNKIDHDIEQKKMEETQPTKFIRLPLLPVLPSSVTELQQQIALHNVSIRTLDSC